MRQRRILIVLASVLLVVVTAVGGSNPVRKQSQEYAVYSAVLRQVVIKEGWGGNPRGERRPIGRIVILERQRYGPRGDFDFVKARLPSLEAETIVDFVADSTSRVFDRQFVDIGSYELVADSALRALTTDRNWTRFYDQFPDAPGHVGFSQVGFNQAGTQALVFMRHLRASLWGQHTFYLLRKSETGWDVVGRASIGAS